MSELVKYSEQTFESIKHVTSMAKNTGWPVNCRVVSNTQDGKISTKPSKEQKRPVRILALT